MSKTNIILLSGLTLGFTLLLSGCMAPALVAGAAGGATVANDERSSQAMLDDQFIEAKARDAIYADLKRAKRIHVNVTSYNRVVLLTGEALSSSTRNAAVEITRKIDKVRRVHNEIVIADLTSFSSRTSDSWITSKIKSQMFATKRFDSTRVKVVTENGTVFLMGLVDKKTGKQAAAIASNVADVKRVIKLFEYF